jgi:hypothetical protein
VGFLLPKVEKEPNMARQKQKKSRNKKRAVKTPVAAGPVVPSRAPLTEAWRGRMMQGVVRRGERQPGRSS